MAFNVRQIFAALNDARVDYVVVGGLAVILHGYLRATASSSTSRSDSATSWPMRS